MAANHWHGLEVCTENHPDACTGNWGCNCPQCIHREHPLDLAARMPREAVEEMGHRASEIRKQPLVKLPYHSVVQTAPAANKGKRGNPMSKTLFPNGIRVTRRGIITTAAAGALLSAGILGGCGIQKAVEPFNDAPISYKLDSPALVGSMPDGFNNWASKCVVNGIRIAVIYHGDANRGSVALVQDPNCKVPSSAYSRISGGTP